MKAYSKNKWLWALALAVLIGAAIYRLMPAGAETSSARVGKVTRADLVQRVTIAGTAEPLKSTFIAAPYDGYIKKIFVKLGSKVKDGDPLVSIAQSLQSSENVYPVRAPFSGSITQLLKNEGQYVKANDAKDYVLRIDDTSQMAIQASAPEIDFLKIQRGLGAVIKVSAILSRSYKGIVGDIAQSASSKEQWGQRSQVDYSLKVDIKDADEQIRPGMTAIVDIITGEKKAVLTLEHEFIYKEKENYYVVLKNGERRSIKVGLQNETAFEITDGLKEGDEVRQIDFAKLNETK